MGPVGTRPPSGYAGRTQVPSRRLGNSNCRQWVFLIVVIQQATNREISRVRARVEHPFALMSGQAGRIFQRYVGLARNAAAIVMLNLVYNLQWYEQIRRLKLEPR